MKNYGCDVNKMEKELKILMENFNPIERLSVIMTVLDYTLVEEDMTIEDILTVRKSVIDEVGEVEIWED